jgi:hypothetical protein
MKKLLLLLATFALVVAACGGGDDDTASADLPINDGSEPAIGATCLAGEPDCNDTPGGGEPQDLPTSDDGEPISVMTVSDAAAATGQVTVTGFVVQSGDEARLCEALAESFPPQCGGASIILSNLDQIDPDSLQNEGEVTWTDYAVTVFGEMADGTLMATPIE